MRISRVNVWNTSRLAYDGSGRVRRGSESEKTQGSYSLCEFTTGEVYNCDLNASYNIGARYFVREIIKSLPATEGQRIAANVPGVRREAPAHCPHSLIFRQNFMLRHKVSAEDRICGQLVCPPGKGGGKHATSDNSRVRLHYRNACYRAKVQVGESLPKEE